MNKGSELLDKGANPNDLKLGMNMAVKKIIAELTTDSSKAVDIDDKPIESVIRQIALVSANSDTEIGDIVAEAITKVGHKGMFDIESALGGATAVETSEGVLVDSGFQSPLFITNYQKQKCELDNPYVLLYDRQITTFRQIHQIIKQVLEQDRSILIVCGSAEDEALATLVTNKMGNPQRPELKKLKVCVVRCPSEGYNRQMVMEDIQHVVGGVFASGASGVDIEKMKMAQLGSAKKIIVTKTRTTIIGGSGDYAELKMRVADIQIQAEGEKDKEKLMLLRDRIAKLTGGVALIKVGGNSETEIGEKKDRVDDALRAVVSACEEGYVAGGGATFLKIASRVFVDDGTNEDVESGFNLVIGAIQTPFKQILFNAGVKEKPTILGKGNDITSLSHDVESQEKEIGYNVKTKKLENFALVGIVDPVKVLRCSLENAVTVTGIFLNTGATLLIGTNSSK
jgi:chaperonin GroEL